MITQNKSTPTSDTSQCEFHVLLLECEIRFDHGNSLSEVASPISTAEASQIVRSAQSSKQINTSTLVALANMHVIDHSLQEISQAYRFTLEEVQEFYDKCGEMGRTRQRFQLMREFLAEKFPSDV